MRKQILNTAIAIAAIAACFTATASPTLIIEDGVMTTPIITTNSPGSSPGYVFYKNTSFDNTWSVVITEATTKPLFGSAANPDMEIDIQATSYGSSSSNLTFIFSDTDFGPTTGKLATYINGSAAPGQGGTVNFNTYYDSNNLSLPTIPLTASGNLAGSPGNPAGWFYSAVNQGGSISSAPYSLTEVVTISGTPSTSYSLSANLQAMSLTCAGGTGQVGIPYSSALVVSGGCAIDTNGDYNFSIISGKLPPGLTLNTTNGTITGIPTQAGNFPYVAQVTDCVGRSADTGSQGCGITIGPLPSASCVTIAAVQGTAITPVQLVGTGGCGGPYTFSATGLPNGLTMSTNGIISGTPTVSGTFNNYSVIITDKCGNTGTLNCSITVKECSQASVCGNVFMDCNGDGFLTPGFDSGMPGVSVILKNAKGITVATNTTDSQGNYCFYNLTPGTYTVSIVQPANNIQTAGTCTYHWLGSNNQQCWVENDNYLHCKGANGVDCWIANDGCQHWKNSSNQDCWTDKYGNSHTQQCKYVSCDVPTNNAETFTLAPCQALTGVNFSYQGVVPNPVVCVTGPSKGICGQTGTYICTVTNAGTACFSACQVTVCGNSYNCPSLSPGQCYSFQCNYKFKSSDCGKFNCQATATCTTYCNTSSNSNGWNNWNNNWNNWNGYGSNNSNSCTAQGNCYTSVGYY